MRINAGKWKGRSIISVDGYATRPTPDIMKQALFNIIGYGVDDCLFCDIFAGTGNVALEALSRGARSVTMIENSKAAIKVIYQNIAKLGCEDDVQVINNDVLIALKLMRGKRFDYIFIDPPYNMGYENVVLTLIYQNGLLTDGGTVIVQFEEKNSIVRDIPEYYEIIDERKYGRSAFVMLKIKE